MLLPNSEHNVAVVILAAGKGKRMRSGLAKVLHRLNGKPLAAHVLETATRLGPARIVMVVGCQAEGVKEALASYDCSFVLQKEQKGTAHAVMRTEKELIDFKGEIVILSGDVPLIRVETLRDLLKLHRDEGATISLLSAFVDDPTGYGRIIRTREGGSSTGRIALIREEKDASSEERQILEINAGIYCIDRDFLFENLGRVGCGNRQGEYYLTDLVKIAVSGSFPVICLPVECYGEIMGINTPEELALMESNF